MDRYKTMDMNSIPITLMDGTTTTLNDLSTGATLVVNVASRCGFTPQYGALEQLHQTYGERGLTIVGFPTNQFLQELGSDEKVAEFCSLNYGVTFPMSTRVKVNGKDAHPLFNELHSAQDTDGKDGKVKWNFEKFLILPSGEVHRFRSKVKPDDPALVDLIEASLVSQPD